MNYRILFNDQKTKDINEEEYELFLRSVSSRFVKIGNDIINYSNVARVEPVKNYENEYPRLPEQTMKPWNKARKIHAIKSMREGFLRRVSGANNLNPEQSEMLKNMDRLILKAENIKITETTSSLGQFFGNI
jgi:hypothetical protein